MVTTRTATTPLSPGRRGLPPPLALDLIDMDRTPGWIRGDAIGFRGFGSELEAAHAAWVAYRGLARRLAKSDGRRPIPVDTERLTLGRRGDTEVVLASGRRIATLLRPGVGHLSGDESFGFELRLPVPTDEVRMRAMASVVYRELRKSGVRWAMWVRDRRRSTRERAVRAPNGSTAGLGWGLPSLALVLVLLPGLVMVPRVVGVLVAILALAALAIVSLREVLRRWWAPRARRPANETSTMPTATARGDGQRPSAPRWPPIATVAGLVVLLIAFHVPERLALILSSVGLAGLLAIRLFATRALPSA